MARYHVRGVLIDGYPIQKHPNYYVWSGMKARCYNKNDPGYLNYGGRGITVCKRWLDSFQNFVDDMGIKPNRGFSIDRIDNDGNYELSNCRWATRFQQSQNRRTFRNNPLNAGGITKNKSESFSAIFSKDKKSYQLGTFATLEEAVQYRQSFIELLEIDPEHALLMTVKRNNCNSTTGIRGIAKSKSGYTITRGDIYIGHSTILEKAILMLKEFEEAQDDSSKNSGIRKRITPY